MKKYGCCFVLILAPWFSVVAIPPPDMIVSGLQSVLQLFGVTVAFLVSGFFLLKDNLKLWWHTQRLKLVLGLSFLGLLAGVAGGYWFFDF